MMRFTRTALLFTLVGVVSARQMSAQATDSLLPHSGTWAAETPPLTAGGSVLRFTSPRTAWLVGLNMNLATQHRSSSLFGDESSPTSSSVQAQLGHRWYAQTAGVDDAHFRTTYGAGLIGSYGRMDFDVSSDRQWNVGAYGELGATWFFTRHLSLGAIGMLDVTRGRDRQTSIVVPQGGTPMETTATVTTWSIGGNLVRLVAAVYF